LILFFLIPFLIISFFTVFFFWRYVFYFRNPNRKIAYDDEAFFSPADGFIVYCKKVEPGKEVFSIKKNKKIMLDDLMFIDDKTILNKPGWLIGVVMTIFDVHYNRTPISGYIRKIRHDHPTKDRTNKSIFNIEQNLAVNKKPYWKNAEHLITNERASYIIKNDSLSVYVTQIADCWIDKIITFKDKEDLKQGEVFGMIKLGSQVDVFIPDENNNLELLVEEGEHVRAGYSKLMRIKKKRAVDK